MNRQSQQTERLPQSLGAVLCMTLAVLVGCGSDSYPVAPVSGTIVLDGKPLAGARIGFEPKRKHNKTDAGPGSYATTNDQGQFQLASLDGDDGAVIGQHVVWIRSVQVVETGDGRYKIVSKETVPPKYNDSTTLTFTVTAEGTDKADFRLKSR